MKPAPFEAAGFGGGRVEPGCSDDDVDIEQSSNLDAATKSDGCWMPSAVDEGVSVFQPHRQTTDMYFPNECLAANIGDAAPKELDPIANFQQGDLLLGHLFSFRVGVSCCVRPQRVLATSS